MEIRTVKNTFTQNQNVQDGRIIRKAQLARNLLHKGNTIIDIKPSRDMPGASVFVFANTEKLKSDMDELMAEYAANKEKDRVNINELVRIEVEKRLKEIQVKGE